MNTLLAGGDEGITNPIFGDGNSYKRLLASPDGGSAFLDLILPKFIGLILLFGSVAFFFAFLFGAISWTISGSDKAHVEAAKSRITNSLIGFILMMSVFAIVKLVETFFSINILSIDIGPLVIE